MMLRAHKYAIVATVLGLALAAPSVQGRNLIVNGAFDDPDNPLKGWVTDYAWQGNRHYIDNASRVSVVPQESGRRNVAHLRSSNDAGTRLESMLIPYVQDGRYRATLRVKGGPYRIYFAGYQWTPGIRPHDQPTLQELRQVYRSRAEAGQAASWQTISLEIPGVEASELSLQHLRRVRFITLYIWFVRDGFVDDVTITQVGSR